jgi:carbohydrate kinase (thermoresistant glucokinase family)
VAPPVIVLMGVTGSGKTTVGRLIAEHLRIPFVDADDFHDATSIEKMRQGIALEDADRAPWLDHLNAELRRLAPNGVVVACSALTAEYRERLVAGVDEARFVVLSGPPELLHKRIQARTGHFAPASLLPSQLDTLEIPEDAMVVGVARPPVEIAASILKLLELI